MKMMQKMSFMKGLSNEKQYSMKWWKDFSIIMTVFAVTGSSSVYVSKPILQKILHVEGIFVSYKGRKYQRWPLELSSIVFLN